MYTIYQISPETTVSSFVRSRGGYLFPTFKDALQKCKELDQQYVEKTGRVMLHVPIKIVCTTED